MPPSPLVSALPAWWFLGFDQNLLGWQLPLFGHLGAHVPLVLGLAGLLAAAGYGLSYRRCVARAFDEQEAAVGAPGRLSGLVTSAMNSLVVRTSAERAAFYFVWQTVARSRTHRMLLAAWAGAGVALVLEGITGALAAGEQQWWQNPSGPLLLAPIVLPVFLVTGLRYGFTVPSDLRANWTFQAAATGDPAGYLRGVRKAAILLEVVPLFTLLAPVYAALWGWLSGGLHVLFGAVSAWLLVEVQLVGLEKLPYTCSYVPGKANLKTCWTFYVLGYLTYVSAMSWLDLKILEQPLRFLLFLAGAVALKIAVERYRKDHSALGFQLLFDERPEPVVLTLELQQ
jgi:hypothetical protein